MNKKPTAVASRGFVEIFILATTSTLGIGGYYYPGYQNYQRLSDLQEHFGKNTNGTAEVKQSIQRCRVACKSGKIRASKSGKDYLGLFVNKTTGLDFGSGWYLRTEWWPEG